MLEPRIVEQQVPVAAVMSLTLLADGKLNVHGPLENWVQCFRMLDEARRAIEAFHLQRMKDQRVVIPTARLNGG